jgi:hypothetical protein
MRVIISWLIEINDHTAFLSHRERNTNCTVQDQMSMKGAAKWQPVVLPATLGQAQSNVQG